MKAIEENNNSCFGDERAENRDGSVLRSVKWEKMVVRANGVSVKSWRDAREEPDLERILAA